MHEGGGVGKAELANGFFGGYNPYALTLSGGWLHDGNWHHRGDVYLDGEAIGEQNTREDVTRLKGAWHAQVDGETTTLRPSGQAPALARRTGNLNIQSECERQSKSAA